MATLKEALEIASRHYQAGQLQSAESIYSQIIGLVPNHPIALHWLGIIYHTQGKLGLAETHVRKALEAVPEAAAFHNSLGVILQARGNTADALTCYQRAIEINPQLRDAYCNLGSALIAQGRFAESEKAYRKAIELFPDWAQPHNGLGVALKEQGLNEEAIACYREAIRLNPKFPEAYNNLGLAYQGLGKGTEALNQYRRALELNPRFPELQYNLGNMMRADGNHAEAISRYRFAQSLRRDYADAIAGEASVYEVTGEYQKCYDMLRPLIEAGKANVNTAISFGMVCGRLNRRDEAISLIEGLLNRGNLAVNARMSLNYVLGKLCDEQGNFDRAFTAYHEANSLKPRQFDRDELARYMDTLIQAYSREFMAQSPRSSIESEVPVFILGMPRSGTSLVEQILASHPAVFGAGELNDMNMAVLLLSSKTPGGKDYPECLQSVTRELLDSMATPYLERLRSLSGEAARITDKMPGNFMHVGLLPLLFPKARIIHTLRDPVDTCLSCYFQNFVGGHNYAYDLTNLGFYYRQYARLMNHWRETLQIPMLEVHYEELVENQEEWSRKIIAYCGLEWDDACLRFHETKRLVRTASYDQVRKPLYKSSVNRAKLYEKHLAPLRQALTAPL